MLGWEEGEREGDVDVIKEGKRFGEEEGRWLGSCVGSNEGLLVEGLRDGLFEGCFCTWV